MKRGIKTTTATSAIAVSAMSLIICVAATTNALASPTCGTHKQIESTLASQYSEKPMHRGLTQKGTMVEVYASTNGTFTVVITQPTGVSCLAAAGTHWQKIENVSHSNDKDTSNTIERDF